MCCITRSTDHISAYAQIDAAYSFIHNFIKVVFPIDLVQRSQPLSPCLRLNIAILFKSLVFK